MRHLLQPVDKGCYRPLRRTPRLASPNVTVALPHPADDRPEALTGEDVITGDVVGRDVALAGVLKQLPRRPPALLPGCRVSRWIPSSVSSTPSSKRPRPTPPAATAPTWPSGPPGGPATPSRSTAPIRCWPVGRTSPAGAATSNRHPRHAPADRYRPPRWRASSPPSPSSTATPSPWACSPTTRWTTSSGPGSP